MQKNKQQYGQYMTPKLIADFMVELIDHHRLCKVLEPSCGNGSFLESLESHGFKNLTAYEIDSRLLNPDFAVRNSSFVSSPADEKFDVIIGNPPYIRWKNLETELKKELEACELWNTYCNSLCDYSNIFIIKSVQQLKEEGELIFITPEYWLSTTHAQSLRNFLLENGILKEIFHFSECRIFRDVTVSLVIFKFIKTSSKNSEISVFKIGSKARISESFLNNLRTDRTGDVKKFSIPQYSKDSRWILCDSETQKRLEDFEQKCGGKNCQKFGDFFEIGNGMVSGLDAAFQVESSDVLERLNESEKKSAIKVIKAKHIQPYSYSSTTTYIFITNCRNETELKDEYPLYYEKLLKYKEQLLKRYDYKKNINFWEWSFLRNYELFNRGEEKIFVPCKERISNKKYFRFCLAPRTAFPTQDVTALCKKEKTQEDLLYALSLLNSPFVFEWLSHKGIRKGDIVEFSEKPVASIPYRKINFEDEHEKEIHDEIVDLTKKLLATKDEQLIPKINQKISELFF